MKRIIYHTILLLLAAGPFIIKAQPRLFFSVSAVDRLANNTKVASYVTSIKTNTACLQVVSGLYAFYGVVGTKLFVLDCPTGPITLMPTIKFFPIPVVNYGRIQSNVLIAEHPTLQVGVVDAAGRVVLQRSVSNTQLYAGYGLYLGMLAAGTYFLKIESVPFKQVIPFIKVN